ncbi:ArfGap-domain-containing protein [Lichtheimia hyalospora FSU 10163]|nr:ArfGap-domain-containing protein [Lichtheimia hyalospora FSU 10163]
MSDPAPSIKSSESATLDLEDGPLFRATITQLEGRTGALKANVKRILKAAMASLEAKRALLQADTEFVSVLRDISSVEPLFTHYLNDSWPKIHEQWERLEHSMQSLLLDPLEKLYQMDIKTAEHHRRQFEEESKDYYTNLGKYLKTKTEQDDGIQQKKKQHFDLVRFDYHSFLMDLHGGKKNQELLYHLFSYQQKQHAFYQTMAESLEPYKVGLDQLASLMADASREQNQVYKERHEKRKMLEGKLDESSSHPRTSLDQQQQQLPPVTQSPPFLLVMESDLDPSTAHDHPSTEDKFRGIRDLQQQDRELISGSGRRKEGFLFATSKPSKHSAFDKASGAAANWHKYWCVLSGGQLHEYSNWKGQLQTHIDPINLRFATAREARNTERRFCFEVITNQFRRIYQATSHEEMQSWIATINNAIESLLNGMGSSVDLSKPAMAAAAAAAAAATDDNGTLSSKRSRNHARSLSGALRNGLKRQSGDSLGIAAQDFLSSTIDTASTEQQQHQHQRFRWSTLSFGKSPSLHQQPFNNYAVTDAIPNTELLSKLKQDPSNGYCADCGDPNPEWCSLNLGILLCIECSGIHRSLGTHISKVRSLTLDSASYTPDIVSLLRALGNGRSNAIWESSLSATTSTTTTTTDSSSLEGNTTTGATSPKPDDTRNTKLKYIQAKYVERAFVQNTTDDPQALLFDAIDKDDIPAAMHAIALGADINACRKDEKNVIRIPMGTSDDDNDDEQHHWEKSLSLETAEYIVRYPIHFALLHGRVALDHDDREHLFPMAEMLLQNGADTGIVDPPTGYSISELVGIGDLIEDEAITYLNTKNAARGQSPISRSSMPPPPRRRHESNDADKLIV